MTSRFQLPLSRRRFMGSTATAGIGAAAAVNGLGSMSASGADLQPSGAGPGFSSDEIAARDMANLAASIRARRDRPRYQPLTAGIVHFFGYGQSLSLGFYGNPVLSSTQPYDNLMIGQATRAVANNSPPPATSWVPVGPVGANGVYPFEPMIATVSSPYTASLGETPGEGAMNFLRRAYLMQNGIAANPNCRFVLTNCGIGGQTIAQLSAGASPDIFNRLQNAATAVKATADSLGLSYQVGGVIWSQGEQDVLERTSYSAYLASLQALQQSFLNYIVQGIAGQSEGVTVPWFCYQPDSSGLADPLGPVPGRTLNVYQALLDWATTPGSDFYMGGPVYQYPNHNAHLTANGYRWHANQIGKAMTKVLLGQLTSLPLYVTSAMASGTSVLVDLNVPAPPLIQGTSYSLFTNTIYPNLGFIVTDTVGMVPIISAEIVGQATILLQLGRTLASNPVLQAGWNQTLHEDWGTNICDSDATVAESDYVYTPGVQDPGEDITSWNGQPLIGHRYPLNNYLALGQVPIALA